MANTGSATPTLAAGIDDLQSAGRYSFGREEFAKTNRRSAVAIEAGLRRLKQRGRIASPRRGFYVIVPVEYRSAGCPPASWFLAELMRFLGQPYYVGILSAAALHGAGHQQPMVFQVVTNRPTRPAQAGRVRITFHMSRSVAQTPTMELPTETGTMTVATPEATAFDLVRYQHAAGQLGNVATVLAELVAKVDPEKLRRCATSQAPPDVQRLGFLLEKLGHERLAAAVELRLAEARVRPVLLAPGRPRRRARPDRRWLVLSNDSMETDL